MYINTIPLAEYKLGDFPKLLWKEKHSTQKQTTPKLLDKNELKVSKNSSVIKTNKECRKCPSLNLTETPTSIRYSRTSCDDFSPVLTCVFFIVVYFLFYTPFKRFTLISSECQKDQDFSSTGSCPKCP